MMKIKSLIFLLFFVCGSCFGSLEDDLVGAIQKEDVECVKDLLAKGADASYIIIVALIEDCKNEEILNMLFKKVLNMPKTKKTGMKGMNNYF